MMKLPKFLESCRISKIMFSFFILSVLSYSGSFFPAFRISKGPKNVPSNVGISVAEEPDFLKREEPDAFDAEDESFAQPLKHSASQNVKGKRGTKSVKRRSFIKSSPTVIMPEKSIKESKTSEPIKADKTSVKTSPEKEKYTDSCCGGSVKDLKLPDKDKANPASASMGSEWKIPMTANFHRDLQIIERTVLRGVAGEDDEKTFAQGFTKQAEAFDRAISKAFQSDDDPNYSLVVKKSITIGSLAESFKNAQSYLDYLLNEKKVKLEPAQIDKTLARIIFALHQAISVPISQNKEKFILNYMECSKVVDNVLAGKDDEAIEIDPKAHASSANTKKDNTELKADFQAKVQKTIDLEAEVFKLSMDLKKLEKEKEALSSIKSDLEDEVKKNKDLTTKVTQVDLEKNALKDQLSRKESDLKRKESDLASQINKLQDDLAEASRKFKSLYDEKVSLKSDFDKTAAEANAAKKEAAENLSKFNFADNQTKMVSADLKRSQEEKQVYQSRISQLENDISALNRKSREIDENMLAKQRENQGLQDKIKLYSAEVDQAKIDNQILISKLKKYGEDIDELQRKNKELEKNIRSKSEENLEIQLKIGQLKQEKEVMLQRITDLKEEKEKLASEVTKTKNILSEQFKNLARKNRNIEGLIKKRDAMQEQLASMKERLVTLEFAEKSTKASHKEEIDKIKEEMLSFTSKLDQTVKQLKDAAQEKEALVGQISKLKEAQEGRHEIISGLQKNQKETSVVVSELEGKIKEQEKNIKTVQNESLEAAKSLEKNKVLVTDKLAKVEELSSSANKGIQKVDEMKDQLLDLKMQRNFISESLSTMEKDKQSAQTKASSLQNEISSMLLNKNNESVLDATKQLTTQPSKPLSLPKMPDFSKPMPPPGSGKIADSLAVGDEFKLASLEPVSLSSEKNVAAVPGLHTLGKSLDLFEKKDSGNDSLAKQDLVLPIKPTPLFDDFSKTNSSSSAQPLAASSTKLTDIAQKLKALQSK